MACNIAAVAQRTGIASDTLRKWERRYGVLRPKPDDGWAAPLRRDGRRARRVAARPTRRGLPHLRGSRAARSRGRDRGSRSAGELREALVEAARAADSGLLASLVEQAFTLHPVERAIEEIVQPALESIDAAWAIAAARSPRSTC